MKTKSITIIGKRWFERVNGNTYHSVIALVNGEEVVNVGFEYGYGSQYEWTAATELDKKGFLPGLEHYKNGGTESLWSYCEKNKIKYSQFVSDVQRKKDL
jgi:hypothetical protein